MTLTWALIAFAVLPACALGLTVFNLLVWPRGDADRAIEGEVSVLIPARDEADTIEACVRAVCEAGADLCEVIVYEDRSSDGTRAILERLADDYEVVTILEGEPLPEGWVGKPHACHRLAERASGDRLVFVDADTIVADGGIRRLVSLIEDGPAGEAALASAVPAQRYETFGERLIIPLLHVTYTSWLPMPLVWLSDDPRFLAANGQLMALRRDALDEIGGIATVCDAVVDDVELARAFKRAGKRVVFGDGRRMATCRMYGGFGEIWEGFSKNLYEGLGSRPVLLAGVVGLYLAAFVVPYVGLAAWAAGWAGGAIGMASALGVGQNIGLRTLMVITHGHPIEGGLTQPLGVLALVGIAGNSLLWHRRGEIRWAGRVYAAREARESSTEEAGP
ncbi:MAG: glycosyltransferase family 2 protein [Bradymonadaceae bacterium]